MPDKSDGSFEALAVPHLALVYRVARRLARDEHAAEDLVQETYLKAYRAFDRFELRGFGIRPWLLKILHNTFLNRYAQEQRGPKATEPATLEQVHGPEASPPPTLDYDSLDQEVKQAIDELSEEFRSVLLLWATMELTYQEIADILELPIGTVMSRLHRARQQLIRKLNDYAVEHHLLARDEHAS